MEIIMNQKQILNAIEALEQSIKQNKTAITILQSLLGTNEPAPAPQSAPPKKDSKGGPIAIKASSLPASELGPTPNLDNPNWPIAVSPNMIVTNKAEPEKVFRALQVLGAINLPFNNKRVLDFGCGEGFVSQEIARKASKIVGYDYRKITKLKEKDNLIFTDQKSDVIANGPYDTIILYDVLDHLVGEQPEQLMPWLYEILADNGTIFIRTHPWTARHGGHAYDFVNKAFVHLALTPDEMAKAGIKLEHNLKLTRPISAYERWFADAGFKTVERKILTDNVDPFISGPLLDRIMKVTWAGKIDAEQAKRILSNSFIDYVLVKTKSV